MTSLPRWHDGFIGRETDIAAILEAIEQHRLVTVCGPGGIGKTRTVAEAFERLRRARRDPHHVAYCELWTGHSVHDVAEAIATQLDLPVMAGAHDPVVAMGDALAAEGPAVVWIDCALPPVDGLAQALATWLESRAPTPRYVVTSRVDLGLPGEATYALGPMTVGMAPLLRARVAASAVAKLDDADDETLAALLARLDGIPLAIELAAARLDILTVDGLRRRLVDRMAVLRDPVSDHRHASLDQVIGTSWDLLDDDERRVLCDLARFQGEIDPAAAAAVVTPPGARSLDAVLAALVRKSFLRMEGARYRLLDTIREFVDHRTPDASAAAMRHAAWAVARGEELDAARRSGSGAAMRALEAHGADLDAAVASAPPTPEGAELACRAVGIRSVVAGRRRTYWAWVEQLDAVIEMAEAFPPSRALAKLYHLRGSVRERLGNQALALADFERGIALGDETGEIAARTRGRCHAAVNALWGRDYATASSHAAMAEAIAREAGDHRLTAVALITQGMVHNEQDRLHESVAATELALVEARLGGDEGLIASTLAKLGAALSDIPEHAAEARRYLDSAVERLAPLNDFNSFLVCNLDLARVCILLGDHAAARAALARADHAAGTVGDVYRRPFVGWVGVWIPLIEGHLDAAISTLTHSMAPAGVQFEVLRYEMLAAAFWMAGSPATAARYRQSAQELTPDDAALQLGLRLFDGVRAVDAARDSLVAGDRTSAEQAAEEARQCASDLRRIRSWGLNAAHLIEHRLGDLGLDAWWIGPDGAWFAPPDQPRVSLARRVSLRRIVAALAAAGGEPVTVEALIAAGWPGETLKEASGRNRLYVAMNSLRKLGFTVVVSVGGGYALDPAVQVRRAVGSAN